MGFFQHVEGEAAVVVENGVYKQVDLYTRDGYLYAKTKGGFVRLFADGSTTAVKMRLDHMSWDGALFKDPMGKLCTSDVRGARQLEAPKAWLLLGEPSAD